MLELEECGFVGTFPAWLSYWDEIRPHPHIVEFWEGPVRPEEVNPGSRNGSVGSCTGRPICIMSASVFLPENLAATKSPGAPRALYDRGKLLEVGGFSFWPRLPRYHSGEEELVQNLLMRCWGGCGIVPSGMYYSEMPSTVLNSQGTGDGHALDLLPEMIDQHAVNEAFIR